MEYFPLATLLLLVGMGIFEVESSSHCSLSAWEYFLLSCIVHHSPRPIGPIYFDIPLYVRRSRGLFLHCGPFSPHLVIFLRKCSFAVISEKGKSVKQHIRSLGICMLYFWYRKCRRFNRHGAKTGALIMCLVNTTCMTKGMTLWELSIDHIPSVQCRQTKWSPKPFIWLPRATPRRTRQCSEVK